MLSLSMSRPCIEKNRASVGTTTQSAATIALIVNSPSDGGVSIAAPGPGHWQVLCEVIGREDLIADERTRNVHVRARNRVFVEAVISDWTAPLTKQQVVEALGGKVPCGPVNTAADIYADPHVQARGMIDLLIPRGGKALIDRVAEEATMPAITGGVGVCHTYVDKAAELNMAVSIVNNAKVSRPSVCNALDTVIVHSATAPTFLPALARKWAEQGVQMRCDTRALSIVGATKGISAIAVTAEDWDTEHLSLTASIKVVDSMDEAMDHILEHGSGHSEAIVSEDYTAAMRFMDEVDAAAVFINASTRFNDGAQFGLGAEVAISTNKIHARGPMGLKELTSYKWTVMGNGQVRN